jgi:hypothetical protein
MSSRRLPRQGAKEYLEHGSDHVLSRKIDTGASWKKAAAYYCATVLRPDLDARGTKKLATAILSLGESEDLPMPKRQITDAQVSGFVWANMQCIYHKCPLLIFGNQLSDEINAFFNEE